MSGGYTDCLQLDTAQRYCNSAVHYQGLQEAELTLWAPSSASGYGTGQGVAVFRRARYRKNQTAGERGRLRKKITELKSHRLQTRPPHITRSFILTISQSFIIPAVCLKTGPQPLPKRLLHRVRSNASSFSLQYPFSLRSFNSCLCLFPRLPVTSILPYIFPPITCFRRQFLCKL